MGRVDGPVDETNRSANGTDGGIDDRLRTDPCDPSGAGRRFKEQIVAQRPRRCGQSAGALAHAGVKKTVRPG
jgi:hypothetical protein